MKKKLKIAVTGGIGSGKSLFCKFFEEDGFIVIHADRLSKQLLQSEPHLQKEIIDAFGDESYINGELNRAYLASLVFSDPANATRINQIVHPFVIAEQDRLMDEILRDNDLAIVEAALIFEANAQSHFDITVLVTADKEIRMQRIIERDNLPREEIEKRMSLQIPEEEKIKLADTVIYNNGTIPDLKEQYAQFMNSL